MNTQTNITLKILVGSFIAVMVWILEQFGIVLPAPVAVELTVLITGLLLFFLPSNLLDSGISRLSK